MEYVTKTTIYKIGGRSTYTELGIDSHGPNVPHCWVLSCLLSMGLMFTMVNHGLQVVHRWKTDRLQLCNFGILLILPSPLSPHPHPCLCVNVEVHQCTCMGAYACAPEKRQMLIVVKHGVEAVKRYRSDRHGHS